MSLSVQTSEVSETSEVYAAAPHHESTRGIIYLCARSATQYWPMPFGVEEIARSTFPRSSRVRPLSDEQGRGLRDHESPAVEQRFFAFGEAHAVIRGRYW